MTDTHNTTPCPETTSSDWQAKSAAHDRLRTELRPGNKTALFDALAAAAVTHVLVNFDGYGDSGQIENIVFKTGDATVPMPEGQVEIAEAKWGQTEPEHLRVSLAEAADQLAYDFLEQTHDGWENNDGAYGDFIFDVAARTITLDYNERFTDSEYSQHVF